MNGERSEALNHALRQGLQYAAQRGLLDFELDDAGADLVTDLVEFVYLVLVAEDVIEPLPDGAESRAAMKERLIQWAVHQPRPEPMFS